MLLSSINVKPKAHVETDYVKPERCFENYKELRQRVWLKIGASVQGTVDRDGTKSLYEEIINAVGPTKKLA